MKNTHTTQKIEAEKNGIRDKLDASSDRFRRNYSGRKHHREAVEILVSELETETDRLKRVIDELEKLGAHPLSVEEKKRLIERQIKDEETFARAVRSE